ncbi:hypothetical protein D082_23780 [Synechocystis sp. PCC 6714]|nr:hypothetical protein D082_23780 [Synechocystis sp. PCC 6714]
MATKPGDWNKSLAIFVTNYDIFAPLFPSLAIVHWRSLPLAFFPRHG